VWLGEAGKKRKRRDEEVACGSHFKLCYSNAVERVINEIYCILHVHRCREHPTTTTVGALRDGSGDHKTRIIVCMCGPRVSSLRRTHH
jgi:hypothetical protein